MENGTHRATCARPSLLAFGGLGAARVETGPRRRAREESGGRLSQAACSVHSTSMNKKMRLLDNLDMMFFLALGIFTLLTYPPLRHALHY